MAAAAAWTLLAGYVFGEGNQLAHFTIIERVRDAEFLTKDFVVNATAQFNPRQYYAQSIAVLLNWAPFDGLMFALTLLGNAAVALAAARFARLLEPSSELGPPIAATLALGIHAFGTGGAAHIPRSFAEPALLARALALPSVVGILQGRFLLPTLGFAGAVLLHPLIGVETAALGYCAVVAMSIVATHDQRSSLIRGTLVSGASLAGVTLLAWSGGSPRSLDPEAFYTIYAQVRTAHHLLPGTWPIASHAAMLVFAAAAGLALLHWQNEAQPERTRRFAVAALLGATLLFCWTAWPLAQWWPTRLGITTQAYRMGFLFKWVGLVLIALGAARCIGSRRGGAAIVALIGWGRAYAMFALSAQTLRFLRVDSPAANRMAGAGAAVAALGLLAVPGNAVPGEPLVVWGLLSVLLMTEALPLAQRWLVRAALPIGMTVLVAIVARPDGSAIARFGYVAPQPTFAAQGLPTAVERWARASTAADAVFLIPPETNTFRLMSRRAVVVDYKFFPFDDAGAAEWYLRMQFAYGAAPGVTLADMSARYRSITDERLLAIHDSFGATHAMLDLGTPTELPIVYEDSVWRVVELTGTVTASAR